jgi:hypothetical protein
VDFEGVRPVVSQTYNDGVSDQVFYTRVTCAKAADDVYRIAGL